MSYDIFLKDPETDEWNAKVALEGLLYLANQCPKAVWVGD